MNSLNDFNSVPAQEEYIMRRERREIILEMVDKVEAVAKSNNEKACIYAVKKLFENADDLEFLNKRAVFVYLREMSGLNPKQLTTTISSLKKKYNEIRKTDEFDALLLTKIKMPQRQKKSSGKRFMEMRQKIVRKPVC